MSDLQFIVISYVYDNDKFIDFKVEHVGNDKSYADTIFTNLPSGEYQVWHRNSLISYIRKSKGELRFMDIYKR